MVGFATDLRARKREEEELRKAHDELEKRVEDRTTELKAARERLRYLMTVTPAIVYTNQASDYTCTFVSENVVPHHGLLGLGDARGQGFLDRAPASRGRQARLRGNGSADRERRRDDRIPLSPSRRPLHLDPGHVQGDPRRARAPLGDRRLLGRHLRSQGGGGCARRAHGRHERPRDAGRREPRHHLHDASVGRLRLHFRQRELELDHGLLAVGDARR